MGTLERLYAKVDTTAPDRCWLWAAGTNPDGYGRFKVDGRMRSPHRIAYELLVGSIPEGLELDHLCRNRGCCNPAHLEPVTHAENCFRGLGVALNVLKTHCLHGHPFDEVNTYIYPSGRRCCRACRRVQQRRAVRRAQ